MRVASLMKRMAIDAIYRRPNTSKPTPGHKVYLRAYGAVSEARASIGRYFAFYNSKRPHSSLRARTPDQMYFDNLPLAVAA
jgi:transposase InsO family protein